ncbi:MAG: 4Fe-4S binding protein [Anaerolineae bacterium]
MGFENYHQHYVCTHAQEVDLLAVHHRFWLSDCGCRLGTRVCARSGLHVCLTFNDTFGPMDNQRPASREEVEAVLQTAISQRLVSRPFCSEVDPLVLDGICHCCDDCCSYFNDVSEVCDKGSLIEFTDRERCSDCGQCVDACYFKARNLSAGKLQVNSDACYGCGLCVEACPEEAIAMVDRIRTGI